MQLFKCQTCSQLLFFENTLCVRCNSRLGFVVDDMELSVLQPLDSKSWKAVAAPKVAYRYCANAEQCGCNWLVPMSVARTLCRACEFNQIIPDLSIPANLEGWRRLELAKRQIVYAALRLGLPLVSREVDPLLGLGFVFAADPASPARGAKGVRTGHLNGVITINIAEADDAVREARRRDMSEPYRTLLGHLRHEIGHYYWMRLIARSPRLTRFRDLFGNETADYATALTTYYAQGPVANWQSTYVSAYASAHAAEDFAETWAHYMHIVDSLDTARAFGVSVHPLGLSDPALGMAVDFDPYRTLGFGRLIRAWLPLTYALNSLSRSMGHGDFYPFVLTPKVEEKLQFVHAVVRGNAG